MTFTRERKRDGTAFLVSRGTAEGSTEVPEAFRARFGRDRARCRALPGDRDEYFLAFADPREAWRMHRGRAFALLFAFAAIAAVGLILMFRPHLLIGAFA